MGLYLLRVTWDFLYLFRCLILLNLKPEFALAIFSRLYQENRFDVRKIAERKNGA